MAKNTSKNFYAVRVGRKVGIYTTWDDCKEQVHGHRGAVFKGFVTLEDAQQFMNEGQASTQSSSATQEVESESLESQPEPKLKAFSATPTPTINGLRFAAMSSAPKTTINGLRASQATPASAPRLETGTHHRVDALKKDAIKIEEPECYFEKFGSQDNEYKPDVKADFNQEFSRLASSQGWVPGTQQFKEERMTALSSQVWTHFFKDALKEEDTEILASSVDYTDPTSSMLSFWDQDPRRKLKGFQRMCRAVRREPGGTLEECKMILKGTLVNIVDLIDACRIGASLEVWTDFEEFESYTFDGCRTIPVAQAKKHEALKCFLQVFNEKGQKRYEALCAQLLVFQLGLPLNKTTGSSSSSRGASSSESEDDSRISPTSSPLTSPCPGPKIEAVEDTRAKMESPSRGRAVVAQHDTECVVTTKRERSESPVFLFERPCKKRVITPALAKDIQSSLKDWPKFSLTQEPDW